MKKVLISGLPSSGNCLIREHCLRSGLEVRIDHAGSDKFFDLVPLYDFMLIPIRLDSAAQIKSIQRRDIKFLHWQESRLRVAEADIPKRVVIFEEIIRTNGKHLDDILRKFVGVKPGSWPTAVGKGMPETGRLLSKEERDEFHKKYPEK